MSHPHPKIRFKEFNSDWKSSRLGDIAKFSKGKGLSKSDLTENGKTECVRYGELYTHYGETISEVKSRTNVPIKELVLSEANDVIIPASGETQIDIATASCILRGGIALGGDLNIIKTKNNGLFLSYYLNNKRKHDIASLAQGISVVHLYSSQLALLNLNIPTLPEQQKIASFLSSVDEKIQQLTRKKELLEQYKKGVMQQLFSGKLRFKPDLTEASGDENGKAYPKWETKRIEDLCSIARSGGTPKSTVAEFYKGEIPFLSISDMTTQGKYLRFTTNHISKLGLENSASWIVPSNSIIYSMYASVGFVAINRIPLATSQAVLNLILKEGVNTEFVYYSLIEFQKKVAKYVTTGTQGNLNAQTVKSFEIDIPIKNEQQKIANYLSAIDTKIENVANQIIQTQTFKKGLLQQMFV
jgi:type I restriction enzyme, S subunit